MASTASPNRHWNLGDAELVLPQQVFNEFVLLSNVIQVKFKRFFPGVEHPKCNTVGGRMGSA